VRGLAQLRSTAWRSVQPWRQGKIVRNRSWLLLRHKESLATAAKPRKCYQIDPRSNTEEPRYGIGAPRNFLGHGYRDAQREELDAQRETPCVLRNHHGKQRKIINVVDSRTQRARPTAGLLVPSQLNLTQRHRFHRGRATNMKLQDSLSCLLALASTALAAPARTPQQDIDPNSVQPTAGPGLPSTQ
jgi:hypothetical protein